MANLLLWFSILVSLQAYAAAATPEARGTWLSTTGPDHIKSGFNTEDVMTDLRNIGLNTVYVETWKNGYTNYPSQSLAQLTVGIDRNTPVIGSSRDLVQETLIHAHRNQMNFVGWFEYGFSSGFIGNGGNPSNPLSSYMKNQGWLLQDQTGKYGNASNGFAWMNPAVPEVRQFLIDITLDAVNRYDLDGIQFDDRLAWPREFGWDATTAALYQADTGNSLPSNVNDADFREWRQDQVSAFAAQLYQTVKSSRPDLHVSVSPSITNFSDVNFNAEWTAWLDDGLFDEYAPQVYRDNISSFDATIGAQVAPFAPNELDKLVVGVRINENPLTPSADLQQMIDRTRIEGAAGHSLWYSKGVRDDYAAELTSFYDVAGAGHADNPLFVSGNRPAPLVATSDSSSTWSVDVAAEGRYRVVAKIGNFWDEHLVTYLELGSFQLEVPGATEVELLVDRRTNTSFLGDLDEDLDVDGADFLSWQLGYGSTAGAEGDTNLDGIVDGIDLARWQSNFGWKNTASPASTNGVPEPNAIILIVICQLCCMSRKFCGLV